MFQKGSQALFILVLSVFAISCSTKIPSWRDRTSPLVEGLSSSEVTAIFPQEYRSVLETFEHGEALYQVRKDDMGADQYYQLAFQKAEVLQAGVTKERKRCEDEKRQQKAELAAKAEQEQLMRAAADAEVRLRARQLAEASEMPETSETPHTVHKKNREKLPSLPTNYTVQRGESLPQISARTEIYNDSTLWPLIYRANRDQISDPKRLWPGQVFVIPRKFSKDEAVEARRYSNKNR